jgi:hypothetical protein
MRTQEEIVARINSTVDVPFNFEPDVLLPFLDFEHAKPFLKAEATEELWEKDRVALRTDESALAHAREYMAFGWDKVLNHRGLSASRTVQKMRAWMWLVGNDELVALCDDGSKFPMYGAPVLNEICRHYGWPVPVDPLLENMIQGRACNPECEEGCRH